MNTPTTTQETTTWKPPETAIPTVSRDEMAALLEDGQLRQRLRRYAGTLLPGRDDDAEDVTQEAILRVLNHPPQTAASVYHYLCQTALNVVRDDARRAKRIAFISIEAGRVDGGEHYELEFPDKAPSAHQILVQEETRVRTHTALRLLQPHHRDVVVQHHIQGRELKSIAADLHVPVGTLKSRLSRGREQVQRNLQSYIDPDSQRMAA